MSTYRSMYQKIIETGALNSESLLENTNKKILVVSSVRFNTVFEGAVREMNVRPH